MEQSNPQGHTKQSLYKCKNLFVATYLAASGKVQLVGLETLDYKTKLFLFSPAEIASCLESEYFSGGSLPAKTIFSEYNNLKDLLFQRESNGENYENKTP